MATKMTPNLPEVLIVATSSPCDPQGKCDRTSMGEGEEQQAKDGSVAGPKAKLGNQDFLPDTALDSRCAKILQNQPFPYFVPI